MSTDAGIPLVSVCVCTYRRPRQLQRLLASLYSQVTNGSFRYEIVVADNDSQGSARKVVEAPSRKGRAAVVYGLQPQQSISLARNLAVALSSGDYVAFVDDDEEAPPAWLTTLYRCLISSRADGVVGPVEYTFDHGAPSWAVKGPLFRRTTGDRTGQVVDWRVAATGNALMKREVLEELDGPFRREFGAGGEDKDFFRRSMARDRVFVWCAEARCYEHVPPERTRVGFQIRRALLRGRMALRGPSGTWGGIAKSALAVVVYAVVMPLTLAMGSHVFVNCLVKAFDHLGKVLAAFGIDLVGEKYIT
jgi:glycosyltransferase involved in cell wall biosynthesis